MTTTGPNDADRYPQFLPDGEHFLYLHLVGDADVAGVYVAALDGSTPVRLLPGQDNALYLASPGARTGRLVFRRQDKLMAQAFNPVRRELSGAVHRPRKASDKARTRVSARSLCQSRQPGLRTRHDYTCGDGVVLIKAPKLFLPVTAGKKLREAIYFFNRMVETRANVHLFPSRRISVGNMLILYSPKSDQANFYA